MKRVKLPARLSRLRDAVLSIIKTRVTRSNRGPFRHEVQPFEAAMPPRWLLPRVREHRRRSRARVKGYWADLRADNLAVLGIGRAPLLRFSLYVLAGTPYLSEVGFRCDRAMENFKREVKRLSVPGKRGRPKDEDAAKLAAFADQLRFVVVAYGDVSLLAALRPWKSPTAAVVEWAIARDLRGRRDWRRRMQRAAAAK